MIFPFPYRHDPGVDPSPANPGVPVYRPKIPLRIFGPDGREALTFALVDTGADETILPSEFVKSLGVRLDPGRTILLGANNRPLIVRSGAVELAISDDTRSLRHRWAAKVGFQRGRSYSVLGHAGCLDRMFATFDGPMRRVTLRTADDHAVE